MERDGNNRRKMSTTAVSRLRVSDVTVSTLRSGPKDGLKSQKGEMGRPGGLPRPQVSPPSIRPRSQFAPQSLFPDTPNE